MIKVNGKLIYGIEVEGKYYYDFTIQPLTLAAELTVLDYLEANNQYTENSETYKLVVESLAFWTQQLTFNGLSPDKLTVELLLDNLTSEDYQTILTSLSELREKSIAAGRLSSDTAAPQPSAATDKVMNATDKSVSS